ncbi:MAG: spore maturation protein [Clostridia bacterium]|nr:spore maturation protein [Clostridia bacterium]
MNILFVIICVVSIGMICLINPESAISVMLEGTRGAVDLSLKMTAIYALWMGILKIMEKSGLSYYVSKIFRPVTKLFFKNESKETQDIISMNLTANFLGMGGAATPLGILAMEKMQDGTERATDNMIMFFVINVTSIQLLPATIIAMRSTAGSHNPSDIILPALIATTVTTLIGIILVKLFTGVRKTRK